MTGDTVPGRSAGDFSPRILASPWIGLVLLAAAIPVASAWAPRTVLVLAPAMGVAGYLVWRHGLLRGSWFLYVLLLPLRGPLGVDVHGTVTLYADDVLLAALVVLVGWERGYRGIFRNSRFFRGGVLLLALGILGVPFAESLVLAASGLQQSVLNVAAFCVARRVVRDPEDATRTLLAFLAGLAPAVAWGFWESTIQVQLWNASQWHGMDLEFDSAGQGHVRVQATYDNTLRFSHPLSVGFGIGIGLLSSSLGRGRAWFAFGVGVAAAWCNRFTYSVGGAVATAAALFAAWWIHRRTRVALLLPAAVVAVFLMTPDTLVVRANRLLTGDSTSALARIVTYQQALRVLRDHPLTGVGWGSAQSAFQTEYRLSRATVGFRAENYFLHRGVALGLPGMLVALALCIRHIWLLLAIRRNAGLARWPRDALLVGSAAFWVQAMVYPVDEASTNQLLWVLFALTEAAAASGAAEPGTGP